jgi:ribosomal protein L25 (general stress protein Ctc)
VLHCIVLYRIVSAEYSSSASDGCIRTATWQALFLNADAEDSRRKRDRGKKKVDVYLSDSSSGNDDEVKQSQSSNRNKGKGHERQVIDLQEDEDEEEEEVFVAWWQRKWRRQLVKEAESGWHLARYPLDSSPDLAPFPFLPLPPLLSPSVTLPVSTNAYLCLS